MDKMTFDEAVEQLQKVAHVDETVAGCFLSIYGNRRVCGGFQNSGCKDYFKCQQLERIVVEGRCSCVGTGSR